ncbi:vitamin B12 dependent-methionine synthase activation domain-containing protein [Streptomyces sp. L7]
MEADLAEALQTRPALDIVNETLLDGMKVVGELFGSGQMQLPFVLQSAEVMKTAVAYLEPHMEKSDAEGKGTIVLATVRGDVHDIGKNLVDIILSNNGYNVVNLGIKQPVSAILEAAEEHRADVIGMSGLLVKSTVIMKENLQELNQRKMAADYPVILGGAALTRAYVEQDLHEDLRGRGPLRPRRVRGPAPHGRPHRRQAGRARREAARAQAAQGAGERARRGRGAPRGGPRPLRRRRRQPDPHPAVPRHPGHQGHPAQGVRLLAGRGRPLQGSVGPQAGPYGRGTVVRGTGGDRGPPPAARPPGPAPDRQPPRSGRRLRLLPLCVQGRRPDHPGRRGQRTDPLHLPAPAPRPRRLCLADFFRPEESGEKDVVGFQIVTVGNRIGEETAKLFESNSYRDYLELHGLSVQLAEALAEYWHARVRSELGFAGEDPANVEDMFALKYRGARFSLGYGACPDLEDRAKIADLLEPERIGVHLSEEFQLHPEQSTDAIVIHHPDAKYFNAR